MELIEFDDAAEKPIDTRQKLKKLTGSGPKCD